MKLVVETELMKNQTHADLMSPGGRFRVLQTEDGGAIFFSLGNDNILYVTRPANGTKTGWTRIDLSSSLAALHPGATVTATLFDVSQNIQPAGANPQPGNIDLAVVVNDGTGDHLYVCQGNAPTEETWSQGVTWTPVPYDDPDRPRAALDIADLYMLQTPNGDITSYFIVDIIGDGDLVRRYFIDPGHQVYTQSWNEHYLSFDAQAGSISSCMGQWPNDDVAGIYTLGTIAGITQLQYQRTVSSQQGVQARVYEFALAAGATAIATALDANGNSHFFVASDGALTFYPPEQAGVQLQVGTVVVTDAFFSGVTQLCAASDGISTVVWAVNGNGHLAHVSCAAGSENEAPSWSPVFRVLENVDCIAPYLNVQQSNTVMFARRLAGAEAASPAPQMTKFEQNATTSEWQKRLIPLPTESLSHFIEYHSYTTHARATADDGLPLQGGPATVTVTAKASAGIYANGAWHMLTPDNALTLQTDATGVLTIVEETTSLTGTWFALSAQQSDASPPVTAAVSPMSSVIGKLALIQSGSDLEKAAKTVDNKGTRMPLLPTGTPTSQSDTVALAVQQFVKVYSRLPQDGSNAPSVSYTSAADLIAALTRSTATGADDIWGVVYGGTDATYYEGQDAANQFGLLIGGGPTGRALDPGSIFSTLWGDVVAGLKWLWNQAVCFFVKVIDGAYHFFIKLGEAIYHFVVDCIYAVGHAVEFVFNKIGVFFKDLIEWLGFIFNWEDILRTQRVLKNIIRLNARNAIAGIGQIKGDIESLFDTVKQEIATWANLPSASATIGSYGAMPAPGQDRPQSNWGIHHFKTNATSGTMSSVGGRVTPDALGRFASFAQANQTKLQRVSQSTQTRIGQPIRQLSVAQAVEQFVAIALDDVLDLVEDGILLVIDICEALAGEVLAVIEAPIEIPIISAIFALFDPTPFTILDLLTLVAAIPTTIAYKIVAEVPPFPDDATTQALIAAQSFSDLQQILGETPPIAIASVPADIRRTVEVTLNLAAGIGTLGVVFTNGLKLPDPTWSEAELTVLNGCAVASYLVYASPNVLYALQEQGAWYNTMNEVLSVLALVKAVTDNFHPASMDAVWVEVSPFIDLLTNLAWLAPYIGAFVAEPGVLAAVDLSADIMSSVSGIIAPGAANPVTEAGAAVWTLAQTLALGYGAISFVYGIDKAADGGDNDGAAAQG
jgi:hypothetical protein